MEMMDENQVDTMPHKGSNANKPMAERTVLAEIHTSNVMNDKKVKNEKLVDNKPFGPHQGYQQTNGVHKKQSKPKTNTDGIRTGSIAADSKPSVFQIFCDSSDSENNISNNEIEFETALEEVKEEMDSCEVTDFLLSERTENSLAIEEEVIQDFEVSDFRCDETLDFDSDEELEDASTSEKTSETQKCFDSSLLSKCKEYADDIHKYLLFYERRGMADPFYIAKQPEINAKMRSILVDWLVEVTEEYKLLDQTLFLAVSYVDRFLSLMSVSRQSFQLLGTSALFISAKYEEIYPPELHEFVYITDDSYTKAQILNMEKLVLKALRFDVSAPTTYYFIEKFSSDLDLSAIVKNLSKYLCHLTLLESDPFLRFYPSEIAICSIILSVHTLGLQSELSKDFLENSTAFEKEVKGGDLKSFLSERQSCLESLHRMHAFAHKHPQQAIQNKYMADKYYRVSNLEPLATSPIIY